MIHPARHYQFLAALLAASAFTALFAGPAAAQCGVLQTLARPDFTQLAPPAVDANTFTPPPPFPGAPPPPPVPVAFCRVQITMEPQINIEVWLPLPENWNHRF